MQFVFCSFLGQRVSTANEKFGVHSYASRAGVPSWAATSNFVAFTCDTKARRLHRSPFHIPRLRHEFEKVREFHDLETAAIREHAEMAEIDLAATGAAIATNNTRKASFKSKLAHSATKKAKVQCVRWSYAPSTVFYSSWIIRVLGQSRPSVISCGRMGKWALDQIYPISSECIINKNKKFIRVSIVVRKNVPQSVCWTDWLGCGFGILSFFGNGFAKSSHGFISFSILS